MRSTLMIAICFLGTMGCSAPQTQHFLHKNHRLDYSLTADELQSLQVFVSERVVAIVEEEQGPRSIVVPQGTPGVIVEVGPETLMVSFEEGAAVPFITDPTDTYALYYVATPVEDGTGLQKLADTEDRIFRRDGVSYQVKYGAAAVLEVDREQLRELIAEREIAGRVIDD